MEGSCSNFLQGGGGRAQKRGHPREGPRKMGLGEGAKAKEPTGRSQGHRGVGAAWSWFTLCVPPSALPPWLFGALKTLAAARCRLEGPS
eukprot:291794-Chlamydomonas_euryale.AAC.2